MTLTSIVEWATGWVPQEQQATFREALARELSRREPVLGECEECGHQIVTPLRRFPNAAPQAGEGPYSPAITAGHPETPAVAARLEHTCTICGGKDHVEHACPQRRDVLPDDELMAAMSEMSRNHYLYETEMFASVMRRALDRLRMAPLKGSAKA